MVKPKFQMKIWGTSYHIQGKPNSKPEAIVKRKNINEKKKQTNTGSCELVLRKMEKKDMLLSKLAISHSLKMEEP